MTMTARRPQKTIAREAGVRGVGFLTGADVQLRFRPAEADTGVVFVRADLPGRPSVPAHVQHVVPRQRRTALQRGEAVVELVEHVMASLAGLQVDNCVVELDATEAPGLDGSSLPFVEALAGAGLVEQDRPRAVLRIERPLTVHDRGASLTAHPGEPGRPVFAYHLDYGRGSPIASQGLSLPIDPATFRTELAPSRTFLLAEEAQALRQAGVGARIGPADILVFGPDGPIDNALRFPDECARHKILDMVGDLALLGADLDGHIVAHRSGHGLNAELARRLLKAAPAAVPPVLDTDAIMKILPHRYPFLLIDRVTELEPGRRVVALKNVTSNEPFFQGHWPGRPVMPGVLIIEALAQAGGLLISGWADPSKELALIAGIDAVKIRRPVVPGDQLVLEVEQVRVKGRRIADVQGFARVDGAIVAEARIRFALVSRTEAA